jgi:hypothetical protein
MPYRKLEDRSLALSMWHRLVDELDRQPLLGGGGGVSPSGIHIPSRSTPTNTPASSIAESVWLSQVSGAGQGRVGDALEGGGPGRSSEVQAIKPSVDRAQESGEMRGNQKL